MSEGYPAERFSSRPQIAARALPGLCAPTGGAAGAAPAPAVGAVGSER